MSEVPEVDPEAIVTKAMRLIDAEIDRMTAVVEGKKTERRPLSQEESMSLCDYLRAMGGATRTLRPIGNGKRAKGTGTDELIERAKQIPELREAFAKALGEDR